jgi:sugar diacid utilization regulator
VGLPDRTHGALALDHPGVRYRLAKIAERTGCDLHRFADLVEILIAARFAVPPAD